MASEMREYTVGELVVNFDRKRKPLSSSQRAKMKGSYPYYGATGVFDYVNNYLFDGEYILLAEDGTVLTETGKPVLQRIHGKTWVNNHAHILRNTGLVDFDYLYYLLKNTPFSGAVTGAVQLKISQANMNTVRVFIHTDKNDQRKIAEILRALDSKIELNNKINDNLQQQAFAIFDKMFSGRLPAETAHVGDYIEPRRGKPLLSKNTIAGNVPVIAGGLEPATYHNIANTTPPVVTISASGANAGFVNLWAVPVWSSDSSYIDSTMTKGVYFWYAFLKKRQQEIYRAQTGSAQRHIQPRHIAELPIAVITENQIAEYQKTVTPLFKAIANNKQENERLSMLRDALLPKLMSGAIDVSDIDL